MKKDTENLKTIILVIILCVITMFVGIYLFYTKIFGIEKENKKVADYNMQILEVQEKSKTLNASEVLSLIYRVENINKKNKEEDIEGKYEEISLIIEVKNEKYVAGREGSKKYLSLDFKKLIKKDLTEFTYLFKDIFFEIIEVQKDDTGRIRTIVIREKDQDKEN